MCDCSIQVHCSLLVLFLSVAGTPTAVTTNRNGLTSVLVSWTAPSPAPAGYEVFIQEGGGSRLSWGNTSSTQLALGRLTVGRTYIIFVVASGAEREPVFPSAPSTSATVTLSELFMSECVLV